MVSQIRLAYYCSGHGYGHATRVSAFASSLLSLDEQPEIFVVSSASEHVFSECISRGAYYRHGDVDPIIAQPLAYEVDRQKSVQVLQRFLAEKEEKLAAEVAWLSEARIDCVLSDAAFLACEAATKACIPSILITNFTFDSVYSYLGAEISNCGPALADGTLQIPTNATLMDDGDGDVPISLAVLQPLVSELLSGYRHADTLLLLPGFIPIPSFFRSPSLPAPAWVDPSINRFRPEIESSLLAFQTSELHPSVPFPIGIPTVGADGPTYSFSCRTKPPRVVKYAPLLVRPASPDIKTSEGRRRLLASIGIPAILHDPSQTHILVVSFGGQTIRRPQGGKSPSRTPPCSEGAAERSTDTLSGCNVPSLLPTETIDEKTRHVNTDDIRRPIDGLSRKGSTKIFIPGAPAPANNPASPHTSTSPPKSQLIRSPELDEGQWLGVDATGPSTCSTFHFSRSTQEEHVEEPSLLPSSSWIAIICGVPSNWSVSGEEEEDLPPGFFVAPRDVYMPDLTAIADVLLGKLGYGTVSESVAQSTPFVYVPRPLFVEEHGLRLLLEAEGTGVELSHHEYESGRWAKKIEEAYLKGKEKRNTKDLTANEEAVKDLANWVLESVKIWQHQNMQALRNEPLESP